MIQFTVVIENLKEAIKGESIAKRKYELFAEKAEKEGFFPISNLFKAVSTAEAIHVKNHIKAFEKLTKKTIKLDKIVEIDEQELKGEVKNTRNNLIQAITGETFEFKKMYKSYSKNANKKELYIAELSFILARKAERIHSELFKKYVKKLDKSKDLEDINIFVCQICGNVELGSAPKICPICEHDQEFFKKI